MLATGDVAEPVVGDAVFPEPRSGAIHFDVRGDDKDDGIWRG